MSISIYLITNRVNGKRYVGQTSNVRARWNAHKRNSCNQAVGMAIKKYGAPAFSFRVIETCETRERANALEIRWIKLCESKTLEHGYNVSDGGHGRNGVTLSEEHKRKISLAHMGNQYTLGRKKTEEECNRQTERLIGNSYALGIKHTDETRAKISAAHRGKKKTPEHRAKIAAGRRAFGERQRSARETH